MTRWEKTADGRWISTGARGTWELAQRERAMWELTLYRTDLTTRSFGSFISRIEGEGHAFMLDARGN